MVRAAEIPLARLVVSGPVERVRDDECRAILEGGLLRVVQDLRLDGAVVAHLPGIVGGVVVFVPPLVPALVALEVAVGETVIVLTLYLHPY